MYPEMPGEEPQQFLQARRGDEVTARRRRHHRVAGAFLVRELCFVRRHERRGCRVRSLD
jgi:hypothetical protein